MAGISSISLPHATIPTQMFGNVNLQNAVMYVNDNFKALLDGTNANATATNDALKGKSDATHTHDEAYAAIGHVHQWQDIQGLSAMLDGKAELNHEHAQYLSSLPAHFHDVNSVNGLTDIVKGKADANHRHNVGDIDELATELGNKASAAYVDQQVANIGNSIQPIVDDVVETKGFAKIAPNTYGQGQEYTTAAALAATHPKDVEPIPNPDSAKTQREISDIGTSAKAARADHQHRFKTETSDLSVLKRDGNGTDGAASFGTSTKLPRIDHSHPLNFPDGKGVDSISQDGMGASGAALFGSTNHYADLGHSHPLNVTSVGTPSDVVKSSGTASLGSETTYARTDHVHKMPELLADDVSYGNTTVGGELDDHESRIEVLEEVEPGEGTVTSVDNVEPDTNGNVALGALTEDDIGDTVQPYDAALETLAENLTGAGKVPFASIDGSISGHNGNCLMYVNGSGVVGHVGDGEGGNDIYNLVAGVNQDGTKIITDDDIGNGLIADNSGNILVQCKTDGGIGVGGDGIYLGGLSGTGFVKSENGSMSIPADQPITASGDGFLKKSGTTVTGTTIAIGDIPTGETSDTVALGSHLHTDIYAPASTVSFPGFGGTGSATTASRSDHTHSASSIVDFDDAVQDVVDEDVTILHTDDLRTGLGTSGKIITTGDVCPTGQIVPCGDNHAVAPSTHYHATGSVILLGTPGNNPVTLGSWMKSGTTNIDVSKIAGLQNSKWMKSTGSGGISTTDEVPITLPSGSGVLKSDGTSVSAGMLADSDIPNLSASKIANGTFDAARIPDLSSTYASKVTETVASGAATTAAEAVEAVEELSASLGDAAYGDIGTDVQPYNSGLATLAGNLDNGKVPLSQLTGKPGGSSHSGNCLVTCDNDGALGHSGNTAFNLLANAAYTSADMPGTSRNANKIITDLDIGNGLEADETTHNIKVKCKTNGGLSATSDGLEVSGAATYDTDNPPTSPSIVSMSANGKLSVECAIPTPAPSSNKVLTCKSGGMELSWEDGMTVGTQLTPSPQIGANLPADSAGDSFLNPSGFTPPEVTTWTRGGQTPTGVMITVCTGVKKHDGSSSYRSAVFSNLYFDENGCLCKIETAKNWYRVQ